jgi:hypothetical protein
VRDIDDEYKLSMAVKQIDLIA